MPTPPRTSSPIPTPHPLADIFPDSPPPSPSPSPFHSISYPPSSIPPTSTHPTHPSDIPRLRTTHSTAGYRDGVSFAKTSSLQPGFDEGYALGAVLGLRVGYVLGVLEGLGVAVEAGYAALETVEVGVPGVGKSEGEGEEEEGKGGEEKRKEEREERERQKQKEMWKSEKTRLHQLVREARQELAIEKVFGREWWGEDGIWRFEVPDSPPSEGAREADGEKRKEAEENAQQTPETTFSDVATSHPLLEKWSATIRAEMRRYGILYNDDDDGAGFGGLGGWA